MDKAERRGRLIAELRERRLWTREELGRRAGLTTSTVSSIEAGRAQARMGTIKKLSEALEVDPLELLHPAAEEPVLPKGEVQRDREEPPLPRRETAAFVIVGRVVEQPDGGSEYRMVVQWNVPPEEREAYRKDLGAMLGDDYLEEEMNPQAAELLTSASG